MIRRAGSLTAALGVISAVLVPATPAAAKHMTPQASVALTDLGVARACGPKRREGCATVAGSHLVKVEWTASCGAGASPTSPPTPEISYQLWVKPKSATRRVRAADDEIEVDTPSGSDTVVALPGRRLFARLFLTCADEIPAADEAGEPTLETQSIRVDSPQTVYVPPRLTGWKVIEGQFCAEVPRRDLLRGAVGAGAWQELSWNLAFGAESMLDHPSTRGVLREVRLRASGRGIKMRAAPRSGAFRRYGEFRASVYTPRSGDLKIWAEIGGVRTNALRIPVVGDPCPRYPGMGRNTFIRN